MSSTLAILEIQDPGNLENTIITIKGADGTITAGANGIPGDFSLRNKSGRETVHLNGQTGEVTQSGDIVLKDSSGQERVRISGQSADIVIKNAAGAPVMSLGKAGDLQLGGGGEDGDLIVRDQAGQVTIQLAGDSGSATLNGSAAVKQHMTVSGRTTTRDLTATGMAEFRQDLKVVGKTTTKDAAVDGTAEITHDLKVSGKITTKDFAVTGAARFERGLGLSGDNILKGNLYVQNAAGQNTVRIVGEQGDIILENADCAEDFDILETEQVEAGTVMVLTQGGKLRQSAQAYDKKVAGVISGAGSYRPGLVLDKKPAQANRLPVALMGKVYCKADARYGPIEVGDLLTTSDTPGHAMRAADPRQAFGAVIGKALRPLAAGQDLIPILIALQ